MASRAQIDGPAVPRSSSGEKEVVMWDDAEENPMTTPSVTEFLALSSTNPRLQSWRIQNKGRIASRSQFPADFLEARVDLGKA